MAKNWDFVPPLAHDSIQTDAEARKFVRQRAMRVFRERQRKERLLSQPQRMHRNTKSLNQQKGPRALVLSQSETRKGHSEDRQLPSNQRVTSLKSLVKQARSAPAGPLRLDIDLPSSLASQSEAHLLRCAKACSAPHYLTAGNLTPLETIEGLGGPARRRLFHHYICVIGLDIHPLGRKSSNDPLVADWIQRAVAEPVLLETVLFHASVHVDTVQHKNWSTISHHLSLRAIRGLSSLMASPGGDISDTAILCVGLLAFMGNVHGDFTEGWIHIQALKRIVACRGGLAALGDDGIMKAHIATMDLIGATVRLSQPFFNWQPTSKYKSARPSVLSLVGRSMSDYELEMYSLLRDMRELSLVFEDLESKCDVAAKGVVPFHMRRAAIEQRLLCLPVVTADQSVDEVVAHIFNACRATSLVCVNYLWRTLSPELSVLGRLKQEILQAIQFIENNDDREIKRSHEELLLWVYSVQGVMRPNNQQIIQGITIALENLGIATKGEYEECLSRHLFPAKMRGQSLTLLWNNIQLSARLRSICKTLQGSCNCLDGEKVCK